MMSTAPSSSFFDRTVARPQPAWATALLVLAAYEQHLNEASPWPYNPTILRTLIFGVLAPIVTVVARRVVEVAIR